jgi:hypothetical protein
MDKEKLFVTEDELTTQNDVFDAPPKHANHKQNQSVATGFSRMALMTIGVVFVIASAGGVLVGMQLGKSKQTSTTSLTNGTPDGAQGFGIRGEGGMMGRGAMGTVTKVSDSSITISDDRLGSDQTFGITSSTKVTSDGASASIADVKTGLRVLVQADSASTTSSDTSAASQIMINPSAPTGRGGFGGEDAPDSSLQID